MEPYTPQEQRVIADEIEAERVRQYDEEEKRLAEHMIWPHTPRPLTPLHDFEEELWSERLHDVENAKLRLLSEDK